jgi:hypothetical protein
MNELPSLRLVPELDSAPAPTPAVAQRRWLDHPIRLTALLSLLFLAGLQCWRPLYHLTDDNLTGWLPQFVEFSQRLWAEKNPFISEALFGGGYHLLKDAGVVSLLSPFVLLCTPLGATRWSYLAPDIVASLNLLTIALAFCWSGRRLRELLGLRVSDGTLVFLSLSYAFSPFNLVVNSSWIGFINSQAALPVITVALHEPGRRRALALITGATLFALLGGHLHSFITMNAFIGLFALVVARQQRSWQPVSRLVCGVALGLLLASPALAQTIGGFFTSTRSVGVSFRSAALSRLDAGQLLASLVLGPGATSLLPEMRVHSADPSYGVAIAFSLANLPLLWVFARKRTWSGLELGLVALVALTALLIVRPDWLQRVMLTVPLIRSLRWPFREVADLLFFVHLLALLNLGELCDRRVRLGVIAGGASFAVILLGGAPTFNAMSIDRELLLDGRAAKFWQTMRTQVGGTPRVIVAGHPQLCLGPQMQFAPFTLLGAYNYAALFGFVNVAGYSPTQAGSVNDSLHPYHFGGIYWYPIAEKIWQDTPGLTLMEFIRNEPALIRVRHGNDVFFVIYHERTGQLALTRDPQVLAALPPAKPLQDPTKPNLEHP